MQGLRSNSALMWAPEKVGVRQPLLILSPLMRTPRTHRLRSTSALIWAPEKAGVRHPLLILSPLMGTPEKHRNGSRVATPKGSGRRRLLEVHMQAHKTLRYGGGLGTNAVQAVP